MVVRRHGVVLARPLAKALALAVGGTAGLVAGWPLAPFGAVSFGVAAVVALRAVWRWERTRIVVSGDEMAVVDGTLRRRSASVPLARIGAVEVEQTLVGRVLGYGTVVAGDLEIPYVPRPRELERYLSAR